MGESDLKTIGELLKEKFYVAAYQRGYRWDEEQVENLLEDIEKFHTAMGLR